MSDIPHLYTIENPSATGNTSENTDKSEQTTLTPQEKDVYRKNSSTFLSVLDDKNRVIATLKQQLRSQKMQLAYYISKSFNNPKIKELSESCTAQVAEDNLQITIAMNHFFKNCGVKTKVMCLYERMAEVYDGIRDMLRRQETVLNETIRKIYIFTKPDSFVMDSGKRLTHLFANLEQFNLLNKILYNMVDMQKELDRFRMCANHLIAIEDERNCLVEQIYLLPTDRRLQCKHMTAIQLERNALDLEMKEIRREQQELNDKLSQIMIMRKDLCSAGICMDSNFVTKLGKMINSVKNDAQSILTLTRDQKDKRQQEVITFKREIEQLKEQLGHMENIMREKDILLAKVADVEDKYKVLFKKMNEDKANSLLEKDAEIAELKLHLRFMTDENDKLEGQVKEMSVEIREMDDMRTKLEELEKVKAERDTFKLQVEDLEAIRRAYSQLVGHCTLSESDALDLEKNIEVLEQERQRLQSELLSVQEKCNRQEEQIKQLLLVTQSYEACKPKYALDLPNYIDHCTQCYCEQTDDSPEFFSANSSPRNMVIEALDNYSSTCKDVRVLSPPNNSCICAKANDNKLKITSKSIEKSSVTILKRKSSMLISNTTKRSVVKAKSSQHIVAAARTSPIQRERASLDRFTKNKNNNIKADVQIGNINQVDNPIKVSQKRSFVKKPVAVVQIQTNLNLEQTDEYELMRDSSKETLHSYCRPYTPPSRSKLKSRQDLSKKTSCPARFVHNKPIVPEYKQQTITSKSQIRSSFDISSNPSPKSTHKPKCPSSRENERIRPGTPPGPHLRAEPVVSNDGQENLSYLEIFATQKSEEVPRTMIDEYNLFAPLLDVIGGDHQDQEVKLDQAASNSRTRLLTNSGIPVFDSDRLFCGEHLL